ncbi:uncharacterized protein LOC114264431 [Camellia sinensis]|uniref:uncharacterized protein LOC114264431 n=1 Tax=Camellia sinensis TaxID=4442 RepID=UPI0010367322|nr:uncharacterized protein LOC114264431 [Camellia sinensis]
MWTIRHWNHFANQLQNLYGFRYTSKQVRQKYQQLNTDYQTFKRLQAQTGYKNVKKFRTKGFEYFQEMADIVENCWATGALSRISTQGALDSDEEDEILNKFWSPEAGGSNAAETILVDLFGDEYMDPAKGKSHKRGPTSNQSNNGRFKKSRSSGFNDVCAAFTTYIQAKIEHSHARSTDTEAVSASGDEYSLDACQDALLELGDIPPIQYIRALTLFKDKEWRRRNNMSSDIENNTMEISSKEDEVIEDFMDFFMIAFMHDHMNVSSSPHDNAILVDSITRADLQFPHPPHGKYYLVDAGFTNMPGFLALFHSQRYHLEEFHDRHYSGPKELFNRRHSSLRNVTERTFGVLKKRFPILLSMPNYKSTKQGPLVIACCILHNWIRLHADMDPFFMEADNEMAAEAEAEADGFVGEQADYVDMSQHGLTYQLNLRDAIATVMWQNHVGHG